MYNQQPYQEPEETTIDLVEIWHVIRRNLLKIFLFAILCAAAVFIYSKFFITPEYLSTTRVYVLPRSSVAQGDVSKTELDTGTSLSQDYIELVKSRPVLQAVITAQQLDITPEELAKDVTATVGENSSRILTIGVLNPDPNKARDMADTLRENVSAQLTAVMNADSVNTLENANLPTSPSEPRVLKNTLIGFLIGIVAAAAFFIIKYLMDDTIKGPDDAEHYLGLTTLAVLPITSDDAKNKKKHRKDSKSALKKWKNAK